MLSPARTFDGHLTLYLQPTGLQALTAEQFLTGAVWKTLRKMTNVL